MNRDEVSYCFNKKLNAYSNLQLSKLDLSLIKDLRTFIKSRLANLAYYTFICLNQESRKYNG